MPQNVLSHLAPSFDATCPSTPLSLFLEHLAKADLTATGYKVALETVARLLRRGLASEAIPQTWVGQRLGLSRNAIGTAYTDLVQAGLLERIPNPARGAPTRTALRGPALALIKRPLSNPRLQPTTLNRTACIVPVQPSTPPTTTPAEPIKPQPASMPTPPTPIGAPPPRPAGEPIARTKPPRPISKKLDLSALMQRVQRLPEEARLAAMQAKNLRSLVINPAWQLTPEDVACLKKLVPPPDHPRSPSRVDVTTRSPQTLPPQAAASPNVAKALWAALPRIEAIVGPGQAHQKADEIAWSVVCGQLGHGDSEVGVRVGLHLLSRRRWSTPRGFDTHWRRAVARTMASIAQAV